jgi:hypothetical protein
MEPRYGTARVSKRRVKAGKLAQWQQPRLLTRAVPYQRATPNRIRKRNLI